MKSTALFSALLTLALVVPAAHAQQRGVLIGTEDPIRVLYDTLGNSATISAPPTRVISALREVFKDLGVEVKHDNPAAGELGNVNFWKMRRFAGSPMSAWMDCGFNATGQNADSRRIYMNLLTRTRPAANKGSAAQVVLRATAVEVAGGSTDPMDCTSNGRLELHILRLLETKLIETQLLEAKRQQLPQ